jgi:hypothetical protein
MQLKITRAQADASAEAAIPKPWLALLRERKRRAQCRGGQNKDRR